MTPIRTITAEDIRKMDGWRLLKSSNLRRCRFFRGTRLLAIEFQEGSIYLYWPVSWSLYKRFLNAESHGKFFSKEIKDNDQIQYKLVVGSHAA